jgi:hypothetical protein
VAMIAEDVKQVRCTTCDADHDFKHAKVPRQRRKTETPAALYAQVLATGPKRIAHESASTSEPAAVEDAPRADPAPIDPPAPAMASGVGGDEPVHVEPADAEETDADEAEADGRAEEDGPIHRRLIRASLPKIDGAPPPTRQIPEFTIRQPGGRPTNRFRPRHQRGGVGGGQQFQGNRSNGGGGNIPGGPRGGGMRSNGGRPPQGPGGAQMRRHGPGRKRSK